MNKITDISPEYEKMSVLEKIRWLTVQVDWIQGEFNKLTEETDKFPKYTKEGA